MTIPDLFTQSSESAGPPPTFPPPGYVPGPSRVQGIEVYLPEQANEKRPEVLDFKCPKCGATIGYNVSAGKLACEYCGYSEAVEEQRLGRQAESFEFRVETLERSEKGWGEARKELACQRCGGVVSTPPDTLAFSCPFCGSNKVLFREPLEDVLRPRYLIPFKVDPQSCRVLTQKWLGSSWMIPSELRHIAQQASPETGIGKFHPLYIPYWTFNTTANASWKAQVGHETVERYRDTDGTLRERHKIDWRNESGKVQKDFSDLLVPGTARLNLGSLARIDNFNITDLVLYEPRYLAGMQAQAYDVPLDEAWDAGRQLMRERTRQACLDRCSSSMVRNFTMTLDFDGEQWRYILAPVYTSVYHYGEKAFQILINGQTGRVAGPRPVDWEKVWLVMIGLLSPGLILALIGWLFSSNQTGSMTVAAGLFLLVVGIVIDFFLFRNGQELEHV